MMLLNAKTKKITVLGLSITAFVLLFFSWFKMKGEAEDYLLDGEAGSFDSLFERMVLDAVLEYVGLDRINPRQPIAMSLFDVGAQVGDVSEGVLNRGTGISPIGTYAELVKVIANAKRLGYYTRAKGLPIDELAELKTSIETLNAASSNSDVLVQSLTGLSAALDALTEAVDDGSAVGADTLVTYKDAVAVVDEKESTLGATADENLKTAFVAVKRSLNKTQASLQASAEKSGRTNLAYLKYDSIIYLTILLAVGASIASLALSEIKSSKAPVFFVTGASALFVVLQFALFVKVNTATDNAFSMTIVPLLYVAAIAAALYLNALMKKNELGE